MKKIISLIMVLFISVALQALAEGIDLNKKMATNHSELNRAYGNGTINLAGCDCYIVTIYSSGKKIDDWYERICDPRYKREDFLKERYTKMGHKDVRVNTSKVAEMYCD